MEKIRLAIWGIGLYGTFLKTAFDLSGPEDMEVVCFSDDEIPENRMSDGKEAVTTDELAKMYAEGNIHAVILAVHHAKLDLVSSTLMLKGIRDIYYLPHYVYDFKLEEFSFDYLERIEEGKPRLSYLEFHMADHCNLNCKGCAHLSNIAEPHFADFGQFEKDMFRLKELFWGIERVRIMGGEPLLNKDLPRYVKLVREVFPDADMHVVSNGLLIGPSYADLFRTMRDYHCTFNISVYPPTLPAKNRIQAICSLYGVRCLFTDPIRVFRTTFDPDGENDPSEAYRHCDVTHCTFLRDGKLSNCITPFLLPAYGKMFGKTLEIPEGDVIDLYREDLTGIEILEHLGQPVRTCAYCDTLHTNAFAWDMAPKGKAAPEDWLAEAAIERRNAGHR